MYYTTTTSLFFRLYFLRVLVFLMLS